MWVAFVVCFSWGDLLFDWGCDLLPGTEAAHRSLSVPPQRPSPISLHLDSFQTSHCSVSCLSTHKAVVTLLWLHSCSVLSADQSKRPPCVAGSLPEHWTVVLFGDFYCLLLYPVPCRCCCCYNLLSQFWPLPLRSPLSLPRQSVHWYCCNLNQRSDLQPDRHVLWSLCA